MSPPTDPRKAYGQSPIPGFMPGQGRWNACDGGRFKQYSGPFEIHVTIERQDQAGRIKAFHISIYHYPNWIAASQDTSGRRKFGLWDWH
ncbi:hypothetical protein [Ferrovibrio sp.]|uniref:hypothetical protein n=1 Tax=Ferrovibrio sp. TaxID=1917215 RepID=UPI00311FF782